MDIDDVRVRVNGNTAVLTGRRTLKLAGQADNAQMRFTHVFVWHDGRWQLTTSQVTSITQP